MALRTLTERELNRALLARQLLLERSSLSLPRTLERMAGLQAQYAPSMYVGLWSRVQGLRRQAVTRALDRRSVIQATLMRGTIHLVSRHDYWPFEQAVHETRREWWRRAQPGGSVSPQEMRRAVRKLEKHLAPNGPVRRAQMEELLGGGEARAAGYWLSLVRVPPSGTWERRRADLYDSAERWIGPPPEELDEEECVVFLIERYLRAFGPATRGDVRDFTGLPLGKIDGALGQIEMRSFTDEGGEELIDSPRAPLPAADTPAPVRFLPHFDATLLVHARRTGILPEEHRRKVFTSKRPQSVGTYTVDGRVRGGWAFKDGELKLEPWEDISRKDQREVNAEAKRLAAFHRHDQAP